MTQAYEKRLVVLAKELISTMQPVILSDQMSDKEKHDLVRVREIKHDSKLNFLLGYILALESDNEPKIENGYVNIKVAPRVQKELDEMTGTEEE